MLTSLLFREQNLLGEATNSNSSDAVLGNLVNMDTSLCYSTTRDIHTLRTELYDKLTEFFPESSTQPRANLIDLLPL